MRKFFYSFIMIFVIYILAVIPSLANETPTYDKNFQRNAGAFYAKGNDIIIDVDEGR